MDRDHRSRPLHFALWPAGLLALFLLSDAPTAAATPAAPGARLRQAASQDVMTAGRWALDLKKGTGAIFVGEPTGGKPNHYGEVQVMRLPESGLPLSYSTKYFQVVEGDPASIFPDLVAEQAFADYRSKSDPALDAALGRKH